MVVSEITSCLFCSEQQTDVTLFPLWEVLRASYCGKFTQINVVHFMVSASDSSDLQDAALRVNIRHSEHDDGSAKVVH